MEAPRKAPEREPTVESADESVRVTAHRSSPDRFVFTEAGNTEGWIATDLAVRLER